MNWKWILVFLPMLMLGCKSTYLVETNDIASLSVASEQCLASPDQVVARGIEETLIKKGLEWLIDELEDELIKDLEKSSKVYTFSAQSTCVVRRDGEKDDFKMVWKIGEQNNNFVEVSQLIADKEVKPYLVPFQFSVGEDFSWASTFTQDSDTDTKLDVNYYLLWETYNYDGGIYTRYTLFDGPIGEFKVRQDSKSITYDFLIDAPPSPYKEYLLSKDVDGLKQIQSCDRTKSCSYILRNPYQYHELTVFVAVTDASIETKAKKALLEALSSNKSRVVDKVMDEISPSDSEEK
ncbi:hypothetical protein [Thaumasiovibrio subtropicus]|uniref:hypothetical protein n=1 Tax=Thaumasiovibrio subtropicus TaxID=1891207 RepID=UPI00131C52B0|nr:hypothetical protein [Thaumasiovibrio subtropicus]